MAKKIYARYKDAHGAVYAFLGHVWSIEVAGLVCTGICTDMQDMGYHSADGEEPLLTVEIDTINGEPVKDFLAFKAALHQFYRMS